MLDQINQNSNSATPDSLNGLSAISSDGASGVSADTPEIPTVTAALAAEKAKAEAEGSGESPSGTDTAENNTTDSDIPEKYRDLPVDEDGIRQFVTKDMLIGDILEIYPQTAQVLLSVGMHCISCGVALYESLEEASYVHGLDPDDVAKVVNDALTTQLIEHPGEEVKI